MHWMTMMWPVVFFDVIIIIVVNSFVLEFFSSFARSRYRRFLPPSPSMYRNCSIRLQKKYNRNWKMAIIFTVYNCVILMQLHSYSLSFQFNKIRFDIWTSCNNKNVNGTPKEEENDAEILLFLIIFKLSTCSPNKSIIFHNIITTANSSRELLHKLIASRFNYNGSWIKHKENKIIESKKMW